MDDMISNSEKKIINLANSFPDPSEFINYIETSILLSRPEILKAQNFKFIGDVLFNHSLFKHSLFVYHHTLKYFIHLSDTKGEGSCYIDLGNAYYSLGDYRKAIEYYEKGLGIAIEIEDKQIECICYTNLGLAYQDLGDYRKAIEYEEKGLSIAIEIEDKQSEGKCYTNLGIVYYRLGNYRKAIEYQVKGLGIAIETGNKHGEGLCYTNLGLAYHSLGDIRKAIEYHEKSLGIAIEREDKHGEGKCYTNLGGAYFSLGEFRKAIENHEKGLSIAIEIGYKHGEGNCYTNLGNAYHSLGEFRKAIEYHEKSLGIAIEIKDKHGEGNCYGNLGNAYHNLNEFRKAIGYHEKSLGIAIEIEDKQSEGICYGSLGNAYHSLGEFRKAIEYHEKSLGIAKEIVDKDGEGNCYTNLGLAYHSLGDIRKAIEYHEKSLGIAIEIKDKQSEGLCYSNLGSCYISLNDYTQTSHYLEKSIDIMEKIGYDLIQEEHKVGYYGLQVKVYSVIIQLFILSKNTEKAFEYLERSKSKAFNEILLMTSHLRPSVKNVSKEYQSLLDKEERLIDKLKAIQIQSLNKQESQQQQQQPIGLNFSSNNTAISNTITTHIQHSKLETDNIINELSLVYDKIENEFDPEYVFVRRSKSFSLSKTQDFLKDIRKEKNKNAVIVEYYIDSIDNKIHIFVISSDSIDIQSRDLKKFNLDEKIDLYLKEISSIPSSSITNTIPLYNKANDDNNTYLKHSQELFHYLIEPISSYISNADLIYFVPFGKLHYIPLHALPWKDNKPLILDHAVAYIPSASLLRFVKNKGTGTLENCLSCGIVFKEEAKEIASIFSSNSGSVSIFSSSNSASGSNSIYIEEPTKKEFTDMLENTAKNENNSNNNNNNNFDILHLSCHGFFNKNDPMSSGLLFLGELLRAKEILDLKINAELVTLSACETGKNENKPGEELVGLTRSFLYAGTPSVLVSLWKVHSVSTRDIMIEFYKQLKNKKIDLATALQTAQKNIMQKNEYRHPYFWAPFILVGDWE